MGICGILMDFHSHLSAARAMIGAGGAVADRWWWGTNRTGFFFFFFLFQIFARSELQGER